MTGPDRERVKEIHARALGPRGGDRDAYLAEACGADAELRTEVESLLRARERMGDFLEEPAAGRLGGFPPEPPPLEPGERVGRYEILEVIGSGGSGTVYEALQERPRRRVALKVMRAGLGSGEARRRFLDEAEILARLKHPGVATVFEAGVHEAGDVAHPWLAMEYVERARTVVEYARSEELDARRRLALFVSICQAIHHGHQKGVVHLDVKPGNVLVDEAGRPKVIDFGIARVAGAEAGAKLIAGTPDYMSPEQRDPDADVDVRSDVYSLGALLRDLVDGAASRDVRAIVKKAMETDRELRYGSAAALAEDIERHLTDRPVQARPPRPLYLLLRFARRSRAAFAAIASVLVVSCVAAVVGIWLAVEKERERGEAELQAYVADIAAAAAALRVNDVPEARRCLDLAPPHMRNWEWRHFRSRLDTSLRTIPWPDHEIYAGAVGPDGSKVAVVGVALSASCSLGIWGLRSARQLVSFPVDPTPAIYSLALDPSGGRVAAAHRDGRVEILSASTGEVLHVLEGHGAEVNAVDFDARGERLATASRDRTVRLWSARTGEMLRVFRGHTDRVIGVAFDPTGGRLASAGREGAIRIWDAALGEPLAVLTGHTASVEDVAWSPDGRRLASGSRDTTVRVWDVATGQEIGTGRGHTGNVRYVAYSPDGETVASGSYDRTVRLWGGRDARPLSILRGHSDVVRYVSFVPDGSRVVSVGRDCVKVWDAARRESVPTLRGHVDSVTAVAFHPDGDLLASGSRDGAIRLWDLVDPGAGTEIGRVGRAVYHLAFAPDGTRLFASASRDRTRVYSVPEGRLLLSFDRSWGGYATVGPLGERLYVGQPGGVVRILETARGSIVGEPGGGTGRQTAVAVDPAGSWLATGSDRGEVVLHRLPGPNPASRIGGHGARVTHLIFGPRGRFLASASDDGFRLLGLPDLEVAAVLSGHRGPVTGAAFSPDGTRLASSGQDGTVRLWDVATGRQVAVLHGHQSPVWCVAFSPDGARLASGGGFQEGRNCTVMLWETGR